MLEFRLLGPLEVLRDGEPVPLAGQRQKALLAALLVRANQIVPTERLVDDLWGEEAPRTAVTSLQNTISQLRKLLGSEVVATRPPGYVLAIEPEQLDLMRFERLVRDARGRPADERAQALRGALGLWRGAPLADLGYEPFTLAETRRLEELRLGALEDRIEAELELGSQDGLIAELEALVAAHPLRERLRGQLMLALYRSGRQAEALAAFQDARRTLVDELGIEPGPALQQLHGSILRQERTLAPAGQAATDEDHYTEVARALLAGRLVPVLGPDVALCGRPPELVWEKSAAAYAPTDADLAAHLMSSFELGADGLPLSTVSQHVAVTRGLGPLYDELHELFDRDYPPGPVHRFVSWLPGVLRGVGLPNPLIVTTSLDEALERAFVEADEPIDVVSYAAVGPARGRFVHVSPEGELRLIDEPNADLLSLEQRSALLKLHGRVDRTPGRDWESFVVSEDDYIDYLAHAELANVVPVTLAAKLRRSHFLFLGYGPQSWHLRVFLRRVWGHDRVSYRSWAVHPSPDPLVLAFWRERDVDTFDVPLDEYVGELRLRIEQLAEART